jgi:hypothetical protein
LTEEQGRQLVHGEIVQLGPAPGNRAFAFCLMVVDEVRPWGVQGYVQALGDQRDSVGGQAYFRATWEEIEPTGGKAVWTA